MQNIKNIDAKSVRIDGIVQGVGFRPFIYRLANDTNLKGFVLNDSRGVYIEIEGEKENINDFLKKVNLLKPVQAHIENIQTTASKPKGFKDFKILKSKKLKEVRPFISPDIAVCSDCLSEINTPIDKRYLYPFINCTNCGPRFTIINDLPYDRINTTMKPFVMCKFCKTQYESPENRRFHAQPNACEKCGPNLSLITNDLNVISNNNTQVIKLAANALQDGKIIAIKGLGGFHLACLATDDNAVKTLRDRKKRFHKPVAIMVKNIEAAEKLCNISIAEKKFLKDPSRPIVLLKKKNDCKISKEIAPNLDHIGIIMPYTPLHFLLMQNLNDPIVLTSGNLSEEPISIDNNEAISRLSKIADLFILHNREILIGCDDSVIKVFNAIEYPVRRSRGYVPLPILIKKHSNISVLSMGADLKNTFCLYHKGYAYLSQHNGDLEFKENIDFVKSNISHFQKVFKVKPDCIAHDLHPGYFSTKLANEFDIPKIAIQHHEAHIASCMADNNINEEVFGVSFDGTGYGDDGKIWGGEFFYGDFSNFKRISHFCYKPLPGGDKAIKEVYRYAISIIYSIFGRDFDFLSFKSLKGISPDKINTILKMIDNKINSPLTSSAGRLFDAVSAISGICSYSYYEGQAAIILETMAKTKNLKPYNYTIIEDIDRVWVINMDDMFTEIIEKIDLISQSEIASRFHITIAKIIIEILNKARDKFGNKKVVLSGGVFQNMVLLKLVTKLLKENNFKYYIHNRVPCNDGGLSLGQAVIAANILGK